MDYYEMLERFPLRHGDVAATEAELRAGTSTASQVSLACLMERRGDYATAASIYRRADEDGIALFRLAHIPPRAYSDDRVALLRAAADLGNTAAMLDLGVYLHGQQEFSAAGDYYRTASASGNADAMYALANSIGGRRSTWRAELLLRASIVFGRRETHSDLGQLLYRRGDFSGAEQAYNRSFLPPDEPWHANAMEDLLARRGEVDGVARFRRQIARSRAVTQSYWDGVASLRRKHVSQAEEHFRRAAEFGHGPAAYQLGLIRAERSDKRAGSHMSDAVSFGYRDAAFDYARLMASDGQRLARRVLAEALPFGPTENTTYDLTGLDRRSTADVLTDIWNVLPPTASVPERQYQRGMFFVAREQDEEAARSFRSAAQLAHGPSLYSLGLLELIDGDPDTATDLMRRAESAGMAEAHHAIAYLRSRANRTYLSRITDADILTTTAEILERHGEPDVLPVYRAAASLGHVGAMVEIGKQLLARYPCTEGERAEAASYLRRAVMAGNADAMAHYARLMRTLGHRRFGDAWEEAAAIAGHRGLSAELGYEALESRDFKRAEYFLRGAERAGDLLAASRLGQLKMEQGRVSEARLILQRAAALGSTESMIELGELCETEGNLEGAESWFRKALAWQSFHAHLRLGRVLEARGDLPEALRHYRKASFTHEGKVHWLKLRRKIRRRLNESRH